MKTVSEIAAAVDGQIVGDGALRIHGVAALDEAETGHLSFLANPRYARRLAASKASAVIVADNWEGTFLGVVIRVKNPDRAFMCAAMLLAPPPVRPPAGIHPTAVIGEGVVLGEGVGIGPHAVVDDGACIGARTTIGANCVIGQESVLGEDCRLYPLVSVRERVRIGNRVIIHNGAVIGSDGFGYINEGDQWTKIPQVGTVEIGDDAEIGANTTVDRARFGKTVIGRGAKIDNLVQVAHNCRVGDHAALAAQIGMAGSSTIGRHAQIGGQVGLAGHIHVGDGAIVGAQSGVSKDVAPGAFVFGTTAVPMKKYTQVHAALMRLPELKKRVEKLEGRAGREEASAEGTES